jgi:hypothetical protein
VFAEISANWIDARLRKLGISLTYIAPAPDTSSVLSCSYRAVPGEYCIYVRKDADAAVRAICGLREKGHILYNHLASPNRQRRLFDGFFRRNMHIILFRLPDGGRERLRLYSAYIYERFAGMAQAMEVNSKLFGSGWRSVRALLEPALPEGDVRRLDYLAFPREGWPPGLDWTAYLLLLCRDMRDSLDEIGSNGKIKTGDISSYNSSIRDESRIKDAVRKTLVSAGTPDGDERGRRGRTVRRTGTAALHSVSECRDVPSLIRVLRERGMVNRKRLFVTDLLYNANRNKFDGAILVPRRLRAFKRTPAHLCILLDVSGSIPAVILNLVVRAIMEAEGGFNKRKSRLVCWSDSLCSDTTLSELRNFSAGGGTIMASGIEYCKRYLDANAVFFIISDFQDDIGGWMNAAKGIKARKTAVAFAGEGRMGMGFDEWFARAGSNADYRKTEVTLKEFAEVFDCVLLDTSADGG